MEAATLDPPITPTEDEGPDLELDGVGQLSFDVGGMKPTTASARLYGGKIEIPAGALRKGGTLKLDVEAQVVGVAFDDHRDSNTGDITGCERTHKLKITGVHIRHGEGL